jgi:hypothetical protein
MTNVTIKNYIDNELLTESEKIPIGQWFIGDIGNNEKRLFLKNYECITDVLNPKRTWNNTFSVRNYHPIEAVEITIK